MATGPDEIFAILERVSLFEGLSNETLRNVARTARPMRLAKGKVLFKQGFTANGCHIVLEGVLKVSVRDTLVDEDDLPAGDSSETVLALIGKGDLLGEMARCDAKPRSATVTALKDTELAHITERDFFKLADADTDIYRRFLKLLSERIRAGNERLTDTQRPLNIRLALILLRLAEAFGEPLPDGRILIRHKMSQAEMGRLVGAARENINRQLRDWESEGSLAKISGYYCLCHPKNWQTRIHGGDWAAGEE